MPRDELHTIVYQLSVRNNTLHHSLSSAIEILYHNSKFWLLFPTSVGRLGYRILQSMSLSGKFFSRTTPSIIARELPTGKINHIYLSQNSLILCFIILIYLVRNCRAEISPRPVSQDVHLCTTFYLYRLNYVAHTLQILCFCQQLVYFWGDKSRTDDKQPLSESVFYIRQPTL